MDRRQKDAMTMAELAELAVVSVEKREGRQHITCRADNGVERRFSISMGGKSDPRGDQNELSAMKRFARENADQSPQPQKRETLTMQKVTSKQVAPNSTPPLDPIAFYKVCEWLKSKPLATFPNMEALALGAAKHIGSGLTEADMATAMQATGITEPVHWSEPTDPHAILVRELGSMMKELGVTASPAFARLRDKLLPA